MWLTGALAGFSALAFMASHVSADEKGHDHDHDHGHAHHAKEAGPNGGRILHSVEPHLEFLVTKDRKIKLSALGEDLKKVVPVGDLKVSFSGGDRTAPTRLSFSNEGGALVSSGTLPEGKNFPVVLVIKDGGEKPIFERFQLDLSQCPTCDYLEYACTCDHHHHGEGGHDHGDHKHDHGHDHKHEDKPATKKPRTLRNR